MCFLIVLMSVLNYNVNYNDNNIEKPLNEKVCQNLCLALFIIDYSHIPLICVRFAFILFSGVTYLREVDDCVH